MKRLFVIVVATICVAYKENSIGTGILTAAAMAQIFYMPEIIVWGVKNDPKWPIPPHL